MKKLLLGLMIIVMLMTASVSVVAGSNPGLSLKMINYMLSQLELDEDYLRAFTANSSNVSQQDGITIVLLYANPIGVFAFNENPEFARSFLCTMWDAYNIVHKDYSTDIFLFAISDEDEDEILLMTDGTTILDNIVGELFPHIK